MIEEIEQMLSDGRIDTVLTDSRSLSRPAHTLFVALRTANNDGHKYIPQLLQQGVKQIIVDTLPDEYPTDATFHCVPSTLKALQELAAAHRAALANHCTVVAVTGSRGKTIVKEWLAATLEQTAPTARSPRSYNSQIGVPLSLLGINAGHKYAVIEAGVSECGEMATLEQIIAPDVVVITNVNRSEHSDGFSSWEEKCREKISLARRARCVVFPAELQEAIDAELPATTLKVAVELPADASWNDKNKMLCLSAAQFITGKMINADDADSLFRPLRTRLDVSEGANNCMLIVDRFTCDLFSLDSALDFMARRRTAGRSSTLILDSLHSATAPQTYQRLAEMLCERHIDRFIGVGREFEENADLLPADAQLFATAEDLKEHLSVTDFSSELILAKGEEGGAVATLAETLQARHHETVLEVNLDAIIHNFNHYRAMIKPTTGLVAMVKASGYGAGSYELAKTLQSQGAAYLAVAVVDEGEELRRAGITMPIMALNPKVTDYNSLFANRLEPEVFSFDMLAEIISEGTKRGIKHYPIHLKFDTGMHRLGFLQADIPALAAMLVRQDVVDVRSVFSHLATADCLDMDHYTLEQLQLFSSICAELQQALPYTFLRHILNSAGIARFPEYQFDMVRLGIGLYGVDTLGIPQTRGLRTVSTLRTIIISIKEWPEGTAIGYSRRTVLSRPTSRIATIPVGYADGLDRHLGNRHGEVMVNGVRCPIVGNVCMDACMIDVTDAPATKVGDSVEIFGENLPVDEMAQRLDTIPYEILTSVSPRVKRVYYRE